MNQLRFSGDKLDHPDNNFTELMLQTEQDNMCHQDMTEEEAQKWIGDNPVLENE